MMTRRLEVVGFTFMIPLFFVVSGMGIDVPAVVAKPLGLLAVVVGILLCRGVPVLLAEHFFDTRSGLTTRATEGAVGVVFGCGSADYCGGDGGCDQFGSFGGVHGVAAGCRRRADGSAVPAMGVGYSSGVWFWSAGAAGAEP